MVWLILTWVLEIGETSCTTGMLDTTNWLVKVLVIVGAAEGAAVSGALVGKETSAGVLSVDSTVGVSLCGGGAATGVQAVAAKSMVDAAKRRGRSI